MADKVITAEVRLTGRDDTGGAFNSIGAKAKAMAEKLASIGKGAAASAKVDQMTASLKRAETQLRAIDKVQKTQTAFSDARTKFQATQDAMQRTARAMAAMEKPSQAVTAAYERAQNAVSRASEAFDRQKTSAIGAKRALDKLGVPAGRIVSEQKRIRSSIEETSAALVKHHQTAERTARRRTGYKEAGALAALYVGHKATQAAKETFHTYREYDRERRFGRAVMGITDEQQEPLVRQAIHMGGTTKYNDIQVLESQRELAARGLDKDQILGLMGPAADLGQSLDLKLPDAVKQMEGALFGFKKDTSTTNAAMRSARETADRQVKAAKISGMTPDDLTALYKYGATPSYLAGVSEPTLLAYGGVSKKANMRGDEAGTGYRALMAAALHPTAGGKTAMLAAGLNYADYQKAPAALAVDPFARDVAARYGVKLDAKTRAGLSGIFADKDLISDPSKFAPAVTQLLRDSLGGKDAKNLKSIAGAANRYRDASMKSVDVNALIIDLMRKLPGNLALANNIFGSKNGGKIVTALGDPATLNHMIDEIRNNSEGYAAKISEERMAGFDGAVSRFEGAVKNLETAIGRSFDDKGHGGPATKITSMAAEAVQELAEQSGKTLQAATIIGGAAGTYASLKGALAIGGKIFPEAAASLAPLLRAVPWIGGAASMATTSDILRETPTGDSWLAARYRLNKNQTVEDLQDTFSPRARAAAPDYSWLDDRPSNAQGDSVMAANRYRFTPGQMSASDNYSSIGGGSIADLVSALRGSADKPVQVESTIKTEGMITVRALPGSEVVNVTSRGDIKLGTGATTVGGPAPGPSAN